VADAPEMPSRRGYKIGAALLVIGGIGAFAWFNYALTRQSDAVNEFQRLSVGGQVTIAEPGSYTIWASRPCAGNCRPEPASVYQRHLTLRLKPVSGGEEIVTRPFPGSAYYNVGGSREGRAVWLLEVPEVGTYGVIRRNDGEVISPPLLLGAGRGLPVTVRAGVVLIGGSALLAALPLFVITYVRHRRALTRLSARLAA